MIDYYRNNLMSVRWFKSGPHQVKPNRTSHRLDWDQTDKMDRTGLDRIVMLAK